MATYDFANSGPTAVVITVAFNACFAAVVAGGTPWATPLWTATLSASHVLIVLSAPVVGAVADACAWKKRLPGRATAGCVSAAALFYFVAPGTLAVADVIAIDYNIIAGFRARIRCIHAAREEEERNALFQMKVLRKKAEASGSRV